MFEQPNTKEHEQKIADYVEYALSLIEENPESLSNIIEKHGIETGVPNYVAAVINKIEDINAGDAIAVTMVVLSTVDKMIMESGQEQTEDQRLALITTTVQRLFETNKKLGDEMNGLLSESGLEPDQEPGTPAPQGSAEPQMPQQSEQGVL